MARGIAPCPTSCSSNPSAEDCASDHSVSRPPLTDEEVDDAFERIDAPGGSH